MIEQFKQMNSWSRGKLLWWTVRVIVTMNMALLASAMAAGMASMVLEQNIFHTILTIIFAGGIGIIVLKFIWKNSDFINCYAGDRDDCGK